MRVEKINFTVGESKSEIKLFPDGKEFKSKNTYSILIGKNGSLKSTSLMVIADFYRKTRRSNKDIPSHVSGSGEPSKIIAISSTTGDRFALSRQAIFPNIKYDKSDEDLKYLYFGPKSRVGFANRYQVEQLMEAVAMGISSKKSKASMLHIFKDLGYAPSLHFVFKKSDKLSKLSEQDARARMNQFIEKKIGNDPTLQDRIDKISKDLKFQEGGISYIWDLKTNENYSDMFTLMGTLVAKKQLRLDDLVLFKVKTLKPIKVNELSSGEANLLLKSLSLASIVEDDSLILFDEPENSLHPNWQISFFDQFKKVLSSLKGCHTIIATHSPHILSSFDNTDGAVVELRSDNNGSVTGIPIDFEMHGWSVEKILLDVFGIATTRNYYFETKLRTLLKEIRSESPSKEMVSSLVQELDGFAQDANDPLRNVLSEARKYM